MIHCGKIATVLHANFFRSPDSRTPDNCLSIITGIQARCRVRACLCDPVRGNRLGERACLRDAPENAPNHSKADPPPCRWTRRNQRGRKRLNGITQVWERLFLGSLADAERLAKSNPHRITAVLTLCPQPPRSKAIGAEYFHFSVADDRPIPAGLLDTIFFALSKNIRLGRVLVHCVAGSSRSPIIIAAWMQIVGYRNIEECLSEIVRLRPIVDPSPVLLASIKEQLG